MLNGKLASDLVHTFDWHSWARSFLHFDTTKWIPTKTSLRDRGRIGCSPIQNPRQRKMTLTRSYGGSCLTRGYMHRAVRANTDGRRHPDACSELTRRLGVPTGRRKNYHNNTIFVRHQSLQLSRSSFIFVHLDNQFAKAFDIDDDGELIQATRSCEGNRHKSSM